MYMYIIHARKHRRGNCMLAMYACWMIYMYNGELKHISTAVLVARVHKLSGQLSGSALPPATLLTKGVAGGTLLQRKCHSSV